MKKITLFRKEIISDGQPGLLTYTVEFLPKSEFVRRNGHVINPMTSLPASPMSVAEWMEKSKNHVMKVPEMFTNTSIEIDFPKLADELDIHDWSDLYLSTGMLFQPGATLDSPEPQLLMDYDQQK